MGRLKMAAASVVATAGIVALGAAPALAANDKGVMYDNPSGGCTTGATGGTAEGFANLNDVHSSVNGVVSLKGAMPNTTYAVTINASDVFCTVISTVGTLTTNGQGNGSISVPATSVAGQPGWFVEALSTTGDFIASPAQQ